jgi:hypothetical protein
VLSFAITALAVGRLFIISGNAATATHFTTVIITIVGKVEIPTTSGMKFRKRLSVTAENGLLAAPNRHENIATVPCIPSQSTSRMQDGSNSPKHHEGK